MRGLVSRCVVGVLLASAMAAGVARAASYPKLYVFGDSLSDAGNDWIATARALPISPPYANGRFSNGPVWAQDLAPAIGAGQLRPSLAGGTDFAYGGAESGTTKVHQDVLYDLPGQLIEFVASGSPNPNGLFVLWIGANDLFDILADQSLTPDQAAQAVEQVVTNEVDFVAVITLLGARNLLVVNAPDLGATPFIASQGQAASAAASALSASYNTLLAARMSEFARTFGLHLTLVDAFALIDGAIADPAPDGFKNVTSPCWTGSYTADDGTLCSKTHAGQDRYLFWDMVHPTAKAHTLIAKAAKAALDPIVGAADQPE
jgi:phospholipase/lecithinase/hemolysin